MSGNINLSEASLIDNIFEGRNKSYGAYELRTNSSKRTVFALIVSSIFFIALVFALYLSMKKKDKVEMIQDSMGAIGKKSITMSIKQTLRFFEACLKKKDLGSN